MKPLTVRIAQADVPNLNGRVYPRNVLEQVAKDVQQKDPARVFGTIGMPIGANLDISNISHSVSNLRLDDEGYLIGDVMILETPQGEIMKRIMAADMSRSFRVAGIGKLAEHDGITEVVDFRLLSINYVHDGA